MATRKKGKHSQRPSQSLGRKLSRRLGQRPSQRLSKTRSQTKKKLGKMRSRGGRNSGGMTTNDSAIKNQIIQLFQKQYPMNPASKKRELIGQGSYGCVFRPPISCLDSNIADQANKISKLMDKRHAEEEIVEHKKVDVIDPNFEFHFKTPMSCSMNIGTPGLIEEILKCEIHVIEDLKKEILKKFGIIQKDKKGSDFFSFNNNTMKSLDPTRINTDDFWKYIKEYFKKNIVLLIEDDGGEDFLDIEKKGSIKSWSQQDKIKFLVECRRLFNASIIMDNNGPYYHMDIKPENVVYNKVLNRVNIIDYGLAFKTGQSDNNNPIFNLRQYFAGYNSKKYHYNQIVEGLFLYGSYKPSEFFTGRMFHDFNDFVDDSITPHFFGYKQTVDLSIITRILTYEGNDYSKIVVSNINESVDRILKSKLTVSEPSYKTGSIRKLFLLMPTEFGSVQSNKNSILEDFKKSSTNSSTKLSTNLYDFLSNNKRFKEIIEYFIKPDFSIPTLKHLLVSHPTLYKLLSRVNTQTLPLDIRFKMDYYNFVSSVKDAELVLDPKQNKTISFLPTLKAIHNTANTYQIGLTMMFALKYLLTGLNQILLKDLEDLFYNMMNSNPKIRLDSSQSLELFDEIIAKHELTKGINQISPSGPSQKVINSGPSQNNVVLGKVPNHPLINI